MSRSINLLTCEVLVASISLIISLTWYVRKPEVSNSF